MQITDVGDAYEFREAALKSIPASIAAGLILSVTLWVLWLLYCSDQLLSRLAAEHDEIVTNRQLAGDAVVYSFKYMMFGAIFLASVIHSLLTLGKSSHRFR